MRRLVLLFLTIAIFGAVRADAVTLREIVELSKSGLSDEVLLALIDIERRAYPVDPDTLKMLKDSGVSERVIIAMIRSGRSKPSEPDPPVVPPMQPESAPQPQVVVIDHHDHNEAPRVREVAVPVPVYVAVPVNVRTPRHGDRRAATFPLGVLAPSIGLPHSRIGLSAPPPKPTSDPPGWHKSPYLKP